jgi:hypothetical protein
LVIKYLDSKRLSGLESDRVNDSLGSSADGTNSGITLDTTNKKLGVGCYSFDGVNDTCVISNDLDGILTGDFTFSCWAYVETASASSNVVISKPAASSWVAPHHSFTLQQSGTDFAFLTNDGSAWLQITRPAGGVGWHHLVVTHTSGGLFSFYVDNGTPSTTTQTPSWGTQSWTIGNTPYNSRYWDGKIDDVGIWSRVLTASEISDLANLSPAQGYAGGGGYGTSHYAAGGGGGAGAVGVTGTSSAGGNGGIGKINTIIGSTHGELSGSDYYLAGGGGGAVNDNVGGCIGGLGGGGNGAGDTGSSPQNGDINTGGGGGGISSTAVGGNGGTGVVILKLLTSSSFSSSNATPSTTGLYTILTYTSTSASSFTISSGTPDVQYLVVAGGGGGGGANNGGGGGAGGFITGTLSLSTSTGTSGVHTVTVGEGGAGGVSSSSGLATNGGDSIFDTFTSIGGGGGYGGNTQYGQGASGGSGGGGNYYDGLGGSATQTPNGALVSSISNKTGLKAHYTFDSTSLGATVTLDEDFSSDSWVDQDSAEIGVGTNQLDFNADRDGSNNASSIDIGTTLSDSKWYVDIDYQIITVGSTGSGENLTYFALSSTDSATANNSNADRIGVANAWFSTYRRVEPFNSDGAVIPNTGSRDNVLSTITSVAGTYYLRIQRNSSTEYKVSYYPTSARTGTATDSYTNSSISGITGLRYLVVGNEATSHAGATTAITGKITSVKVYNGFSFPDGLKNNHAEASLPTNVQDNSIFVETDTQKRKWFDGTDWFPLGRGIFAGGATPTRLNVIEYITIATTGNTTNFGDLSAARDYLSGCGDDTRGIFSGGTESGGQTNTIEYITIDTTGNATDFGDLIPATKIDTGSLSNDTRGLIAGDTDGGENLAIDYITIATTGNALDFGDLTVARKGSYGCASATRGVWFGGDNGTPSNVMDYVTIATTGDATDFGDLLEGKRYGASMSDTTRGVFGGGYNGSSGVSVIEYITIATTGIGANFGDLTVARRHLDACGDSTRGCFMGGYGSSYENTIDYITITTLGNATNFGDLSASKRFGSGLSDYVK